MSTQRKSDTGDAVLDAEAVAGYLADNTDFFEDHADLVAKLSIPHPTGGAISLVERQMAILRQQNRQLERKFVDLVEIARGNDALVDKMHRLTVALIEAEDLEATVHSVQDQLRNTFGADHVAFCLFTTRADDNLPGPVRKVPRDDDALEDFTGFLGSGKPLCGRLKPAQLSFLFGDGSSAVASAALVLLGERSDLGMLGIGSSRGDAFNPTMSTQYLTRLGDLIGHAIRRHL